MMAAKTAQSAFVSNIATQRQRVGMTQRELAIALDMTEASIQNWESGRAGVTHLQRIMALCELLDCPVQALLSLDDSGPEPQYVSNIKTLRKARKLKQRQVALALQITERTVKGWEKGDIGIDAIAKIIQICNIFDCKIQDLLTAAPENNRSSKKSGKSPPPREKTSG